MADNPRRIIVTGTTAREREVAEPPREPNQNGYTQRPPQQGNWRKREQEKHDKRSKDTEQGVYQIPHRRNPQHSGNWRDRRESDESDTITTERQWQWRTKSFEGFSHMSFKTLRQFSNNDPHSIILQIVAQMASFKELLQSEIDNDRIILILKILAKMCQSSFNANTNEIMDCVLKEGFLIDLRKCLQHFPTRQQSLNEELWTDTNELFTNIITVYQYFIDTVPGSSYKVLLETLEPTVLAIHTMEFEQEIEVCTTTKEAFEKLIAKIMNPKATVTGEQATGNSLTHEKRRPLSMFREEPHRNSTLSLQETAKENSNACSKIRCENNHRCLKKDYEDCGPCQVRMKRMLPCSHEHLIPCFMDANSFICRRPVQTELPCGHVVMDKPCYQSVNAYKKCHFPCDTRIEPCGHACVRTCHFTNDPDHVKYKCMKPCTKVPTNCSTNSHACPLLCYEECLPCQVVIQKSRASCSHKFTVPCHTDVDAIECKEIVLKHFPNCGHIVKSKCCETNSKNCPSKCALMLKCGHQCQKRCSEPCTAQCKEMVEHVKPSECGHKFKVQCHLRLAAILRDKSLLNCQEPCLNILACSHRCSGSCSDCAQGRIHQSCKEKCGTTLICGHKCTGLCHEICEPCPRKCPYKCKHSACKKTCGEPCTSCSEACDRRCRHIQCTAKCGEVCTVAPCKEPCDKRLACGHPCVGYCGDVCPPLCKVCNHEELTKLFFGNESYEVYVLCCDARFVLLDECKHVIESYGMDQWLQQSDNDFSHHCCPKCRTLLTSTQRYGDYIKKAVGDVNATKKKIFGDQKEIEDERIKLLRRLDEIQQRSQKLSSYSTVIAPLLEGSKVFLNTVNRDKKQPFYRMLARTYHLKVDIIDNIVNIFNSKQLEDRNGLEKTVGYIDFLLQHLLRPELRISQQQIRDFNSELKRLSQIVCLYDIASTPKFQSAIKTRPYAGQVYEEAIKLAFCASKYENTQDVLLQNKLILMKFT